MDLEEDATLLPMENINVDSIYLQYNLPTTIIHDIT